MKEVIFSVTNFTLHNLSYTCPVKTGAYPDDLGVQGTTTDYSLSLTTAWVQIPARALEKVASCQWLEVGRWFSLGTPVSSPTTG